jgi:hypothetical protein
VIGSERVKEHRGHRGLKFNFIAMIFAAYIIKLGIYCESFALCPLVEKSVFGLFSPSPYRIGRKFFF